MVKKEDLQIPAFCYWIGLVQSDGCFRKHFTNKRTSYHYVVDISSIEKDHLKKFQEISLNVLNRKVKIHRMKYRNTYDIRIGVSRLIPLFTNLNIRFDDPPQPPHWIAENMEFFGPYLAGIIDGDGDIRVSRKQYPQCKIRITSGKPQYQLRKTIKNLLGSGCCIYSEHRIAYLDGRRIEGTCYRLEFLVSKKNVQLIKNHILPWIALKRKQKIVRNFIIGI